MGPVARMSAAKAKAPCIYCGGPKEPGRGRRVCDSCEETRKPLILQKQYEERLRRKKEGKQAVGAIGRQPAPDGTRWCARCQEYRAVAEFSEKKNRKANYCRPCNSIYLHEQMLKRTYGLSLEEYVALLDLQDGRCAICQAKPKSRRLSVDHDHDTGKVRGLLCTRCNHKLLGAAHDSAAMLRRAAAYLGAPPAWTGSPIPSETEDLFELLIAAWLRELEDTKAETGASLGAIWIEPPSGDPGIGHVLLSTDDYEALCQRAQERAA